MKNPVILIALSLILFSPLGVGAAEPPFSFSDAIPPIHDFISGRDYKIAYEVTNTSKEPLIIVPEKEALTQERGCQIQSATQEPVLPGKKGRIELVCKWNTTGKESSYRTTSPEFQISQGGVLRSYKATVKGMVYPEKYYSDETDTCGQARKIKCDPNKPREKLKYCFISASLAKAKDFNDPVLSGGDGMTKALANKMFCGDSTYTPISVSGLKDVQNKLNETLENTCAIVDTLAFQGHGDLGAQGVEQDIIRNQRDIDTVFGNGKYSCMLSQRPRVIFGGCRLAAGCEGQVLMQAVAQSLSREKPVVVQAPTALHASYFSGISSKTGSVNGADMVLEYQAGDSKWKLQGLSAPFRDPPQMIPSCLNTCSEHLAEVNRLIRIYDSTPQCKDPMIEKNRRALQKQQADLLLCTSFSNESGKKIKDEDFLKQVTPLTYSSAGYGPSGYFNLLAFQNKDSERTHRTFCYSHGTAQSSDLTLPKSGMDVNPGASPGSNGSKQRSGSTH